jgi:hypothetical protein
VLQQSVLVIAAADLLICCSLLMAAAIQQHRTVLSWAFRAAASQGMIMFQSSGLLLLCSCFDCCKCFMQRHGQFQLLVLVEQLNR